MNSLWLRIRPLLSNLVRFMHIAYLETKSNHERTVLGMLWIPISTLTFALLLGLVFHQAGTRGPVQFFLYVLSGYVTWNFISDSVSGSTEIIQRKFDFAIHNNLTLAGLFGKTLADRIFEFGLDLALLIAAVLILNFSEIGPEVLLLVPLIAMLAVTSLAVSYLINFLTVVFPDLANVIKTLVRLMFFATPIFWEAANRTDIRGVLETYNPAAYYLMMMRQVFGIDPLSGTTWAIGGGITALVGVGSLLLYRSTNAFVRNQR